MNYTLEQSMIQGCLQVHISGKWPAHDSEGIMTSIFNIYQENHKPILIDIRHMEDIPSIATDYDEAKQFAKTGFNRISRIAVIDNLERKESNEFFETASYNRGLRFRFFYDDKQEAIDWLLTENENQT